LAKTYRLALFELIREMRRRPVGRAQFLLEDGERVTTDAGGVSYQFEFFEEANLFEGARVELRVRGQKIAGHLTALFQGRIIVTLEDDFGPTIKACDLLIDNTALLQALHDRVEKIEKGEVTAFRADFATYVLRNGSKPQPPASAPNWPWSPSPNAEQSRFVQLALTKSA
jgi:hypothetical protein